MNRYIAYKPYGLAVALLGCAIVLPASAQMPDTYPAIRIITQSPLVFKGPNPRCTTQMCVALKELIDGAQTKIDFALYGYSDQRAIMQALLRAKERGVRIRGVVDKTTEGRNQYSGTPRLYQTIGNIRDDYQADRETLKYLNHRAVVRAKRRCRKDTERAYMQCLKDAVYQNTDLNRFKGNLMHNKFFVIDERSVWTGSANLSATGTGGYNANIVAVIDSPELAGIYSKEFEQMFAGYYHRGKRLFKGEALTLPLAEQASLSVYFSPQSKSIQKGLIPLFRQAQESIDVMIFYLTHQQLAEELVKAHQRGVRVRIILDATAASNQYSKHHELRKQGLALKVESWGGKMHAKSAVVDQRHVVLGSMNWTNAGNRYNDENTLVIRDSKSHAKVLNDYFNVLWDSIAPRWLQEDPGAESPDSTHSCSDGIDNDFDGRKGC